VRLLGIVVVILGILEIWHPDAKSAGGAIGLITAGVAVALQRVITSFAAYLIILRGKIFNVGDRITIGGVRGDVIALDFMQTTVLEIGETPGEQGDAPSVWITARQYTGRMIRITNDKIFDSPVYNFTRVFPYLWEEMQLPISYKDNRREAERILLEVGHKHTDDVVREAKPHIEKLVKEYRLATTPEIEPHVYMRLTDNWVNFSMRFLVPIDGARKIKDGMSRDLIDRLDADETIDTSQIFLFGFSQACALNFRFAFTYPDTLRAVIGVCGGIPGDLDSNPSYKPFAAETFYLYGDIDEFYTQEKFREFDARLGELLPHYRSKQYVAKHEITDEMRDDMKRFIAEVSGQ